MITIQIISFIVFFIIILIVLISILNSLLNPKGTYISWSGDPDPNCLDCHGSGIINKDDKRFEIECPCTMLIVDC